MKLREIDGWPLTDRDAAVNLVRCVSEAINRGDIPSAHELLAGLERSLVLDVAIIERHALVETSGEHVARQ